MVVGSLVARYAADLWLRFHWQSYTVNLLREGRARQLPIRSHWEAG